MGANESSIFDTGFRHMFVFSFPALVRVVPRVVFCAVLYMRVRRVHLLNLAPCSDGQPRLFVYVLSDSIEKDASLIPSAHS